MAGRTQYLSVTSRSSTRQSLRSFLTPTVLPGLSGASSFGRLQPSFLSALSRCSAPSQPKFRCVCSSVPSAKDGQFYFWCCHHARTTLSQANVDVAREDAVKSAIDYFCSPISHIPLTIMLSPGSGGGGHSSAGRVVSPGGFVGVDEVAAGRGAQALRRVPSAAPAPSGSKGVSPRSSDASAALTSRPSTASTSGGAGSPNTTAAVVRRTQSAAGLVHPSPSGGVTSAPHRDVAAVTRGVAAPLGHPAPLQSRTGSSSGPSTLDARRAASAQSSMLPPRTSLDAVLEGDEALAAASLTPRDAATSTALSALAATAAESGLTMGSGRSIPSRPSPRFDVAIGAAVARALASVSGDARSLRDACSSLCNTLIVSRAVDSRSLARAYGERLPHEVCVPPQALLAVADAPGTATGASGTLPIVCDVDVAAAQELDRQLRSGAVGSLILACLRHSHENIQADGLALLCALADTTVDVSSPAMDELSDTVFGSEEEASRASSLSSGAGEARGAAAHALDLPVRMTSLTVSSGAQSVRAPGGSELTSATSGVRVVTVVPVYALGLMQGGGAKSSAVPASGATGSGATGGPGALFRDIYSSLVFLTTVTAESQRSPGKRAVAALRRACPVTALLACTLATLSNPAAEQRSLWSALMLAYSMLGEPGEKGRMKGSVFLLPPWHPRCFSVIAGGPEFFGAPARMNKLVERAAHILASAVASSTPASTGAPSASVGHTAARLGSFVQQISYALHAAHPALFVAAFSRLAPHLQVCISILRPT